MLPFDSPILLQLLIHADVSLTVEYPGPHDASLRLNVDAIKQSVDNLCQFTIATSLAIEWCGIIVVTSQTSDGFLNVD